MRGGWLHTGDVGVFDAEGYLHLKDRSKDLIISGGSNIYPREVEEVLLTHDAVREVSVIGRPDREWGEVVVAYVVGEASAEELDALCLAHIARFKRPKDYVFVDALPKNNYGKILKTELRALDARRKQQSGVSDMADIVLAIGTSHSPLLNSPAEDYPKHAAIDASGRKLLDKNGKPCTYGELLEQADPSIKQQIEPRCWNSARRAAPRISRGCRANWPTPGSTR